MIEVQKISVQLDEQSILQDVQFDLKRGEILGLIGPPESGKTTLFKTLAGLIAPSGGDIRFDDESKTQLDDKALHEWQSQIGMSFQNDALFDSLTVFDNVAFPLRRRGIDEESIKSQVFERLRQVGLEHAVEKFPSEISGGMRKRVGIARAMIINPPIGFFDDPTAGLDPVTSSTILDMVVHLARELNSATMIISNDLPVLFPICDRVLMLHQGEVVFDGKVDEILASENPAVVQFATGGDTGPL
jgi:phospholipid/cholesterol/gamma-HCH transport system ATP-binding protein